MSIRIPKLSRELSEIRDEMYAEIEDKQEEYASKGWLPAVLNLNRGIVRGLIELWCFCLHKLYVFLEEIMTQGFPLTAGGKWLDLHCRQVLVTRRPETKTSGKIVFSREKPEGNVSIKQGIIVKTKPDALGRIYRFITTEKAVLKDGEKEIAIPVTAEEYGAGSNVSRGQICEFTSYVSGIDGVTNKKDWIVSEGADRENDEELRERYFLAWAEGSGSNKYAYLSWAKSIPGVAAVKILDQHPYGPGTVGVIVRGTGGAPTPELLSEVRKKIEQKRPLNDIATISGPVRIEVNITAEISYISGSPETIKNQAEQRIKTLFYSREPVEGTCPLEIGESINIARLSSEIMKVEGVSNVKIIEPEQDIEIDEFSLGEIENINFTASKEE